MKEIKESLPMKIKRTQINFAPYNPKRHTEQAVKQQQKNFRRVGYLGGIVWNKTTGNIVSGHKRIMAMDIEYKYNGKPETDYDVRVEMVEMDEKTEKEQNIFMDAKSTNTEQDYYLISSLLPEIDYKNAGLTTSEYENMVSLSISEDNYDIPTLTIEDIAELKTPETKEAIREKKQIQKEIAQKRHQDLEAYITLSFSSHEEKGAFCELFGYNPDTTKYIKGEEFLSRME
jgi:hypothetical protein